MIERDKTDVRTYLDLCWCGHQQLSPCTRRQFLHIQTQQMWSHSPAFLNCPLPGVRTPSQLILCHHSKRQGIRLAKDTRSDISQQHMSSHIGQSSHKTLLNKYAACPTWLILSENSITYNSTQHWLNHTFISSSSEGDIFYWVLSVWLAAPVCCDTSCAASLNTLS